MISFKCPNCAKGLRADESNAGNAVKCPGCGQKMMIPGAAPEELPPEQEFDEEPERPRKKKRPKFRTRRPTRGKTFVIVICCIVLGTHLLSLISYLVTPDPLAELVKNPGMSKELVAYIQRSQMWALIWMLGSFALNATLLTCLYLRQDWARVVLGILFMLAAGFGILGLIFGGLAAIQFFGGGIALLAILEAAVRVMVDLVLGVALMKSESIQAYTTG
jgi:DNA-directed RNA polymerase subunit RPC12/RpoP